MQSINNIFTPVAPAPAFALKAEVTEEARTPNPFDPATLARIAIEEELKRKGGGGGGGGRSYNPNVWVPYSFKLMAEAIDAMRAAFAKALAQGLELPKVFTQEVAQAASNAVSNMTNPISNAFSNFMNAGQNQLQTILRDLQTNTLANANKLFSNSFHMGMTIFSAIANNLKKIFYTKNTEVEDPDEEIYTPKQGALSRLLGFFNVDQN